MKYFGTSGLRALANTGLLSPQSVLRVGQAIGLMLRESDPRPRVIIGKDTRVSGYVIEGLLSSGLCSVGAYPLLVGPLPAPGVAYLTRGMRAAAGIMVSASHDPFSWNGIKIFDHEGMRLSESLTERVEDLMDDPHLTDRLVQGEHFGRARRVDDALGQYAVYLKEKFPRSLTLEGRRIVVDCANGAGYRVAPKVLAELGAQVTALNDEPNGININFNCGSLAPERLQAEVIRQRADLGFVMDGDAEGITLVDENGAILSESDVRKLGTQAKEGDSGPQDALVVALDLLAEMERSGQTAAELVRTRQKLPHVTCSVPLAFRPPLTELTAFAAALQSFQSELAAQGRLDFRYSGAESEARITVEGEDSKRIREIAQDLERLLVKDVQQWSESRAL